MKKYMHTKEKKKIIVERYINIKNNLINRKFNICMEINIVIIDLHVILNCFNFYWFKNILKKNQKNIKLLPKKNFFLIKT